jgi:hypothetical protein
MKDKLKKIKTAPISIIAILGLASCQTTTPLSVPNYAQASLSDTIDLIKAEVDDYTLAQFELSDGMATPIYKATCGANGKSQPFIFLISNIELNTGLVSTVENRAGAGTVLLSPPGITFGGDISEKSTYSRGLKLKYVVGSNYFADVKKQYFNPKRPDFPSELLDRKRSIDNADETRLFRHLINVTKGVANANDRNPCLTIVEPPQFTFGFTTKSVVENGVSISAVIVNLGASRSNTTEPYNTITFTLQPTDQDGIRIDGLETFKPPN